MKIARTNRLLAGAAALAAVLSLSACGSDDNTASTTSTSAGTSAATSAASGDGSSAASSSGASPVTFECADGELRTSGSTAQGKAMAEWIPAFNAKCSASLTPYGGGGSGQGITDFTDNQIDFGAPTPRSRRTRRLPPRPAVRRRRRDQPADGHRADRHRLQRSRRRLAGGERRRTGKDLRRQDHELERPGPEGVEPGRRPCPTSLSIGAPLRRTPAPPRTSPSSSAAAPAPGLRPGKKWAGARRHRAQGI